MTRQSTVISIFKTVSNDGFCIVTLGRCYEGFTSVTSPDLRMGNWVMSRGKRDKHIPSQDAHRSGKMLVNPLYRFLFFLVDKGRRVLLKLSSQSLKCGYSI